MLTEKYGHLNGIEPPPKGGGKGKKPKKGEPPGQSVSEWGKSIGHDGKGRPNKFELDLGNGRKLLTYVYWAN